MKTNNRFEINDLIDDAVSNAVARRNDNNETLLAVGDEESEKVTGGSLSPIVLGFFPPTTLGITETVS